MKKRYFIIGAICALFLAYLHLPSLPSHPKQKTVFNGSRAKKIFMIAGSPSADRLGAYYMQKLHTDSLPVTDWSVHAIGSHFLKKAGAIIHQELNERIMIGNTGLLSIFKKVPHVYKVCNELIAHIKAHDFDEVVLIDTPLINLYMAYALKKRLPHIPVTYIAPPELWIWGTWGIDKILQCCDLIVTIYPHEVAWYKTRGLNTTWLGYPHYNTFTPYLNTPKTHTVAILPGSRMSSIKKMLPLFLQATTVLSSPRVNFILPLPAHIPLGPIQEMTQGYNIKSLSEN